MKLNFKLDKNYLIKHTIYCAEKNLYSSNKNKKDIFAFSHYIINKYPEYYDFMIGIISPENISEKNIKNFTKKINEEFPNVLNKIKKSKEFKKIYNQTEKYLLKVEKEWSKNSIKTSKFIWGLTKLNLDKEFDVYVTHPSQRNGSYWGNNTISWGTTDKWKNYSTVYLWHEILHSYFDKSLIGHSLIELITDEGLRKQLNSSEYPPFEGHKNLEEIKKKILPHWKKYLKSNNGNILAFQKELKLAMK